MERAEIPQRFAVISLCAFPINRPPVGARAEARRQVPGLSQPPDRPSRQPIPACRRRPRRLLLPQPVTLPMWCEVSDSRIPAREEGLRAAIVCSSLSPSRPGTGLCTLSTRKRAHFLHPSFPHSVIPKKKGFVAEGPPKCM